MRILRLNEQEFINVIMESTKRIILEANRHQQAKKKTIAVIQQLLGDSVDADAFRKKIENDFYHESVYRNSPLLRLEPMICRFAIEANYGQGNQDNEKIQKIKSIMNFLYKSSVNDEIDLSKISLDTSFDDFVNTFTKMMDDKANAGVEGRKKKQYVRDNSYKIIGPVDFKTAHEYGKWSYPGLKLCYTTDKTEDTWNDFTNNGCNNAYIIVKDGFKNIEPVHDDDSRSPYDTYGLSMMFVFVDGNGKISNSNVRWNHEADFPSGFSVDNALDEDMISELVGVNFESVFKPNNKWKELVNNVVTRLRNGENPRNVFDAVDGFYNGFARVLLGNKFNFIREDNHEILREDFWFDSTCDFKNGFASVKLNNEWKYIDTNGKLYTEEEGFSIMTKNAIIRLHNGERPKDIFDGVSVFYNGFAMVLLGYKYNFIREDNHELLREDLWFNYASDFKDGFAKVKLNNEKKYIDTNGKLYTEEEGFSIMANNAIIRLHNGESPRNIFDRVDYFNEGFIRVRLGNKFNFIREDNNEILREDLWFDDASDFNNGLAWVKLNNGVKYIDTNGKLYTEEEMCHVLLNNINNRLHNGERPRDIFRAVGGFNEGFAVVEVLPDKYNFIRKDNNQLLREDILFDGAFFFKNGFSIVKLGNEKKYIDTNGKLYDEEEGFSLMVNNALTRLRNGEDPLDIFNGVGYFHDGFAKVILENKYNFIRVDNNELLSKNLWFDYVYDFNVNGFAEVEIGNEKKYIDTKGNLHDNIEEL